MSFAAFWPRYLAAHADPRTRAVHAAGTLTATTLLIAAVAMHRPILGAFALLAGYGPAWATHYFIERNRPETFRAPFSSLAADFLMTWHVLRGTIDDEIAASHGKTI